MRRSVTVSGVSAGPWRRTPFGGHDGAIREDRDNLRAYHEPGVSCRVAIPASPDQAGFPGRLPRLLPARPRPRPTRHRPGSVDTRRIRQPRSPDGPARRPHRRAPDGPCPGRRTRCRPRPCPRPGRTPRHPADPDRRHFRSHLGPVGRARFRTLRRSRRPPSRSAVPRRPRNDADDSAARDRPPNSPAAPQRRPIRQAAIAGAAPSPSSAPAAALFSAGPHCVWG